MTRLAARIEPTGDAANRARRRAAVGLTATLIAVTGCSSGSPGSRTVATTNSAATAASAPASTPAVLPQGVVASVKLDPGFAPVGMAAGFGSLWVNSHRLGEVARIDPTTNKVIATIRVDDCCVPPVIGPNLVWAGAQAIDPTTNKVVATTADLAVTVADGQLWGMSSQGIGRLDPKTFHRVGTVKINANPRKVSDPDLEVAYGDGAFWAVVAGDESQTYGGVVVKVDRVTGQVRQTYRTPDPGGDTDIQFYNHAVWLKGDDSGKLVRLDARTGATRTYHLPGFQALSSYYPETITMGNGDLWIRVSSDRVVRFRPSTGRVVGNYPASPDGNGGYDTVAFGSLWVANFDADSVWRDRIA